MSKKDTASISKMKHLSQKIKKKTECFIKEMEMEDCTVLFKLMSAGDKERSLTGTSAVVELPTLNVEVQGVNFILIVSV